MITRFDNCRRSPHLQVRVGSLLFLITYAFALPGRAQVNSVPPVSVCGLFFLSAWRSERESGLRVLADPRANLSAPALRQAWEGCLHEERGSERTG